MFITMYNGTVACDSLKCDDCTHRGGRISVRIGSEDTGGGIEDGWTICKSPGDKCEYASDSIDYYYNF